MPLSVSVAIPTLGRPEPARELALQVLAEPYEPLELLVVDQTAGGSPGLEALHRGDARVRYLFERRPSLPGARNVAAREARGEILLFLDDDMTIEPGLVERHARHYEDPAVLGVAGRIRGGYETAPADGPVGYLRWDLKIVRHFDAPAPCDVQFLPGGNFSVRREAVLACGGFDVRFGGTAVGEETDFFLRARAWALREGRRQRRYVYDPQAVAVHHRLKTGGCRLADGASRAYWMMHNVMLFGLRHGAWPSVAALVLHRTARAASMAVVEGRVESALAGLRGLFEGVGSFVRDGGRRYAP